jgi:hypothetical protein
MLRIIPEKILNAALRKEDYFSLHREYTRVYDLPDNKAWEKLEQDLTFYNLPNRYNSDNSFYANRSNLIRVNTKTH